MSDASVGSPTRLADGVAAYVHEVRAELADLPVEDVDDLTGGMEADLSELAAESGGDLVGRLGVPRLYAAELRAAAGLPERVSASGRRPRPINEAMARARASFTVLKQEHPGLQSVTAFLVSVFPAWWVLRGYLAAWAIWSIIGGMPGFRPQGVSQLLLALAGVVLSVQLGRGWMQHLTAARVLLLVGNAVAVFLILLLAWSGRLTGARAQSYEGSANYSPPPGLSLDGQLVGNIYPYDSEGKRITGVRLFSEDGRPLDGEQRTVDSNGLPLSVVPDSNGAPLMNVYPRALVGGVPWEVTDPANPQMDPPPWTPPLSIVPLAPGASPTPAPTVKATSTPSAPATPNATQPTPETTSKGVPPTSTSPVPSSQPMRR